MYKPVRIVFGLMLGLAMLAAQGASGAWAQTSATAMASPMPAAQCEALTGGKFSELKGAHTWIVKATSHPASETQRSFCEVRGYVNPYEQFGMYLPSQGWNGKFIVRGCGGSCGAVNVAGACGPHLPDGFACLITDMGHQSDQIDNNWVENNLQGVVDFGYRATHVTTVAGKAILATYYGKPQDKAYFYGCSTGGRQALVEAQRFPEDFDGVIAVAPASMGPFGSRGRPSPPEFNRSSGDQAILPDIKVPVVYKAMLAQCDMNDGVADGLVNPLDCKFDPGVVQCKGADGPKCLTAVQVEMVRRFYAFGAKPGSELNWINGWTAKPGPPQEFAQSRGDPALIETLDSPSNPDLGPFKAHGGKLILAHGTSDIVVPTGPTYDYYDLVTRTMGGLEATQTFARFFPIIGMDHCSGGDGAWGIDMIAALDAWVTTGKAPDKLVGIRPKLGVTLDYFGIGSKYLKPSDIAFSRPYYAYPVRSYYIGGDPNSAASFGPGMSPRGKKADGGSKTPDTTDSLAAEVTQLVTLTDAAYAKAGLPPKNITDRIGKAVRRRLYTSTASDAAVAAALDKVMAAPLSTNAKNALALVRVEY